MHPSFAAVADLTLASQQESAKGSVSRSTSAGSSISSSGFGTLASPEHGIASSLARELAGQKASPVLSEYDYPVPFVVRRDSSPHKVALPEYDYPVPIFVKNTFLDSPLDQPFSSLDGFLPRRENRSCPNSFVAVAPLGLAKGGDGNASWKPFVGCCMPLLVKNTFLNAPLDRPLSFDGFFHERQTRSAPVSCVGAPPGLEVPPGLECEGDYVRTPFGSWISETQSSPPPFGSSAFEYPKMELPLVSSHSPLLPLPPVQRAPPAVAVSMPPPPPLEWAPAVFDVMCPPPPEAAPALDKLSYVPAGSPQVPLGTAFDAPPKLLRIADSLLEEQPDACGFPSFGSKDHSVGTCRPCAFLFTKGCQNGVQCEYCHLCPPGEKKRRQREKFVRLAEESGKAKCPSGAN